MLFGDMLITCFSFSVNGICYFVIVAYVLRTFWNMRIKRAEHLLTPSQHFLTFLALPTTLSITLPTQSHTLAPYIQDKPSQSDSVSTIEDSGLS